MVRLVALLLVACATMLPCSVRTQAACSASRLQGCGGFRGRRPLLTREGAVRSNFEKDLRKTFSMRLGELATMMDEGGAGDPTLLYNVQIFTSPLIRYGD
jgi:hypothetical protein